MATPARGLRKAAAAGAAAMEALADEQAASAAAALAEETRGHMPEHTNVVAYVVGQKRELGAVESLQGKELSVKRLRGVGAYVQVKLPHDRNNQTTYQEEWVVKSRRTTAELVLKDDILIGIQAKQGSSVPRQATPFIIGAAEQHRADMMYVKYQNE